MDSRPLARRNRAVKSTGWVLLLMGLLVATQAGATEIFEKVGTFGAPFLKCQYSSDPHIQAIVQYRFQICAAAAETMHHGLAARFGVLIEYFQKAPLAVALMQNNGQIELIRDFKLPDKPALLILAR